ncbi:hypothetical protein Loak_0734 [Legionella oakridgensis]|uniref:Uncharacterized protein n=1 Tax=Legionella oakridgensis TaxID=29423 RepID=A0A0W0XD67_9GAMM|nr:hypothetical protein Loak_0734 [Legionella oakridgensis]
MALLLNCIIIILNLLIDSSYVKRFVKLNQLIMNLNTLFLSTDLLSLFRRFITKSLWGNAQCAIKFTGHILKSN